jgi:hypothetical protein
MTRGQVVKSHPLQSRVGPVAWLFLQAASVVASILLAFAIDAWWDRQVENKHKNTILAEIRLELLRERQWATEERAYRVAARDSAKVLVSAVAAGRYEDTKKTLDHRVADLLWTSGPPIASAMVEGLLREGGLAAIEDQSLRRGLAVYPDFLDTMTTVTRQDHATLWEGLTPFLSKNSSLPQISNESYKHGRPGDGALADPDAIVPLSSVVDHSHLLGNQEFAGIVMRKIWNDSDVLYNIDDFAKYLDELLRLIDLELANTS